MTVGGWDLAPSVYPQLLPHRLTSSRSSAVEPDDESYVVGAVVFGEVAHGVEKGDSGRLCFPVDAGQLGPGQPGVVVFVVREPQLEQFRAGVVGQAAAGRDGVEASERCQCP